MNSDLYRELGLSPDASHAEIEAAGRRAAKQHHPDKGGDRDRFDATMRALTVLRDPAKRETYDRTGQTSEEPAGLAEAEGMNLITARLTQILQNPGINLERMDVVAEITRAIQAQKREALANIAETEKAITRLARRDELDKVLSAWTGRQDAAGLASRLQAHGVPAHHVAEAPDTWVDPQKRPFTSM